MFVINKSDLLKPLGGDFGKEDVPRFGKEDVPRFFLPPVSILQGYI